MILGIGTDIIEIERVKKAMESDSFIKRAFNTDEGKLALKKAESAAGIYAAKEAFVKAIGTGFRKIDVKDIEVVKDELGKPYFVFYNEAKRFVEDNSASVHLSITHNRESAVAFVVIERR